MWTKLAVKPLLNGVSYTRAVLFDQYLVVLTHEKQSQKMLPPDSGHHPEAPQATLLAINLQDKSVQEAQIDKDIFDYHDEYTLTKYGANQMIKFGGNHYNDITGEMIRITIKSFKPFVVECEEIKRNNPKIRSHTAHIYKDCLYVFGGRNDEDIIALENTIWSFNLKSYEWKRHVLYDEKPADDGFEKPNKGKVFNNEQILEQIEEPDPRDKPSSFIIDSELYIYGGESKESRDLKDIFVFDLNLMEWKKLEQHETFLADDVFPEGMQVNGDIYQDYLVLLGKDRGDEDLKDVLFCWNYSNNSWWSFEVERLGLAQRSNLVVYDGLLLVLGQDDKGLSLAVLDLKNIEFPEIKPTEKEYRRSLFMNEEQSDVKIEVEGIFLPAHWSILTEKSKHFANVFKSNMSEGKEGMIHGEDCDLIVFQEFLKFLYCEKVDFNQDLDFGLRLLKLADKYLQKDFEALCVKYLKLQINSKNFPYIYDYARQNNLTSLAELCTDCFEKLLNRASFPDLIKYVDKEGKIELRNKAFDFLVENLEKIYEEEDRIIKDSEDFLIQNMTMENIEKLMVLVGAFAPDESSDSEGLDDSAQDPADGVKFGRLRDGVYDFVQRNLRDKKAYGIAKKCSKTFMLGLLFFPAQRLENLDAEIKKEVEEGLFENQPPPPKRTHKRKEPGKKNTSEEKPQLKQMKMTIRTNRSSR